MNRKQKGEPRIGEKVGWNSSSGQSVGKVVAKVISATRIKGHRVAATPENPQFIAKSHKKGAEAAYKPFALKVE
jgi:Hypervirulence associated proteins TUDOR domain